MVNADDIINSIGDEKKEGQQTSDEVAKYTDNSQIITDKMFPLVKQMYDLSKEHDIPFYVAFQIKTEEGSTTYNTTGNANYERGASKTFMGMINDAEGTLKGESISKDTLKSAAGVMGLHTGFKLMELNETNLTDKQREILNSIVSAQMKLAELFSKV